MKQNRTVKLAQAGLVAAVYTALTLLIQPLSFGMVQFRVSELLTVLPVYMPAAIPGLTVGCFLSNLIGLSTGANPAGGWDLLFGTAATGMAAWLTYAFRKVRVGRLPLLATLPPVVLNAFIVGTELYYVYGGLPWGLHVLWVAVGQCGACAIGGCLLAWTFEKTGALRYLE